MRPPVMNPWQEMRSHADGDASQAMRRRGRRNARGVIAVEVAFLIPLVLAGIMLFMELARIMLAIGIGSTAMDAAVQSLRREDQLDLATVRTLVVERMADPSYSYGYLAADEIQVEVEQFDSLQALGEAQSAANGNASTTQNGSNDLVKVSQSRPIWTVTVDVRKAYLTPLAALLGTDNAFQYRFKQVLGHLEAPESQGSGS